MEGTIYNTAAYCDDLENAYEDDEVVPEYGEILLTEDGVSMESSTYGGYGVELVASYGDAYGDSSYNIGGYGGTNDDGYGGYAQSNNYCDVAVYTEGSIDSQSDVYPEKEEKDTSQKSQPLKEKIKTKRKPLSSPRGWRLWNEEFQSLLDSQVNGDNYRESIIANIEAAVKSGDPTFADKLEALNRDFIATATRVGKIIISEINLDDEMKTVHPVDAGGIAGGIKFIEEGIFFKFAFDEFGLFGGDEDLAQKCASHELRSSNAMVNLFLAGPHFPLMCLIDYRGYRLTATSLLPLTPSTLYYGSCDGGATVLIDEKLGGLMKTLSNSLNLKGHNFMQRKTQTEKFIWGPFDIEGHYGTDGRKYFIDTARLFPSEMFPKKKGNRQERGAWRLSYLLRPEFVDRYPTPLNPDALFVTHETESKDELREACRKLHQVEIPETTETIIEAIKKSLSQGNDREIDYLELLTYHVLFRLHSTGINYRHLGIIQAIVLGKMADRKEDVCDETPELEVTVGLLQCEIISRCVKAVVRKHLRTSRCLDGETVDIEQARVVMIAVNGLFHGEEGNRVYMKKLESIAEKKYFYQKNETERFVSHLEKKHWRQLIAQRLCDLLSVILPSTITLEPLTQSSCSQLELKPRIKQMCMVPFFAAYQLSMRSTEITTRSEKQAAKEESIRNYRKALLLRPGDSNTLNNLASCLMSYSRMYCRISIVTQTTRSAKEHYLIQALQYLRECSKDKSNPKLHYSYYNQATTLRRLSVLRVGPAAAHYLQLANEYWELVLTLVRDDDPKRALFLRNRALFLYYLMFPCKHDEVLKLNKGRKLFFFDILMITNAVVEREALFVASHELEPDNLLCRRGIILTHQLRTALTGDITEKNVSFIENLYEELGKYPKGNDYFFYIYRGQFFAICTHLEEQEKKEDYARVALEMFSKAVELQEDSTNVEWVQFKCWWIEEQAKVSPIAEKKLQNELEEIIDWFDMMKMRYIDHSIELTKYHASRGEAFHSLSRVVSCIPEQCNHYLRLAEAEYRTCVQLDDKYLFGYLDLAAVQLSQFALLPQSLDNECLLEQPQQLCEKVLEEEDGHYVALVIMGDINYTKVVLRLLLHENLSSVYHSLSNQHPTLFRPMASRIISEGELGDKPNTHDKPFHILPLLEKAKKYYRRSLACHRNNHCAIAGLLRISRVLDKLQKHSFWGELEKEEKEQEKGGEDEDGGNDINIRSSGGSFGGLGGIGLGEGMIGTGGNGLGIRSALTGVYRKKIQLERAAEDYSKGKRHNKKEKLLGEDDFEGEEEDSEGSDDFSVANYLGSNLSRSLGMLSRNRGSSNADELEKRTDSHGTTEEATSDEDMRSDIDKLVSELEECEWWSRKVVVNLRYYHF